VIFEQGCTPITPTATRAASAPLQRRTSVASAAAALVRRSRGALRHTCGVNGLEKGRVNGLLDGGVRGPVKVNKYQTDC